VTGLFAGGLLGQWQAKRLGLNTDHVWNILVLGLVLGLIGARAYHVIDDWDYYRANPGLIPAIWKGGIGIYGAIAGALLAVVLYTRARKLSFLTWADIGAPCFLLGQTIGRWGNFFNQELYGKPTDLPWGIPIDEAHRPTDPQYAGYTHFHPLFLYESLWSALGVVALIWVSRRFADRLKPGDVLLLYGIWYPTERFVLEFLRIGNWYFAGFATAQIASAISIVLCGGALLYRHGLVPGLARPKAAPKPVAIRRQRRRSR